ncbi:MAG TPA: hypothetical protein VGQ60_01820 [Nitrospiraceae bacterium]|jgi:hypothetical protein|nr:hypothetical protein [Nitrospiraceae bacterium]
MYRFHADDRTAPVTPLNRFLRPAMAALLGSFMLSCLVPADCAEAKRKPAPRPEPQLRIISVVAPSGSYSPQSGPLEFTIQVQLPKELDGATILEVSSLISSPSKRSMRFLSSRQPVSLPQSSELPRLTAILTWDGMDQNRQPAQGRYNYEIEAKLLTVGEKGLRTHMVAWPKRGTVEVK